ncbi:MAG: glycosyltransferase family 4 protein [Planctomycetes bacterium]|nr:glycosyltransferase family 4 protein [Planctomycetota bacterium]
MRLLLVNYEYPPVGGGAATACRHLARRLVVEGHEVTVLAGSFRDLRGGSVEDGVDVERCPTLRRRVDGSGIFEMFAFLVSASLALPRLLARRPFDAAIVYFAVPCGPLGLLFRRLSGKPYVVSLRGGDVPGFVPGLGWLHRWLAPVRRAVLRGAAAVVANSEGLADLALRADSVPVRVIPNGVDLEENRPATAAPRSGAYRFLFVGRLTSQKNGLFLLDVLRELRQISSRDFECSIVGDGPERRALEARARALGLDGSLRCHGWVERPRLTLLYRESDCLVHPSRFEGLSNVLLEAMAAGLPVIASDVPGNREAVEDGETGCLRPIDRPAGFVEAMHRLLEDPALGRTLGARGRERARERFAWEEVARAHVDLLSSGRLARAI